jgi:prepilin-type N-terminal cleavage/methylation domain-containing protein/prepilin-type processing-associated H-X9-DG protein
MRTRQKGFTLIELLVVIAIIALLLSVIMPALGKAKTYAQKVICASNQRQQVLGVQLFANENNSTVPIVQPDPANWFWDVSFWTTNQISLYAGFDDNDVFFCSANKGKKPDDARFWQFSMVGNSTIPVALQDESTLTVSQQKTNFRVMPTLYMFDKLDANGNSRLPATLQNGQAAQWVSKLTKLKNASAVVVLADCTISNPVGSVEETWRRQGNFFEVRGGGSESKYGLFDSSNHASKQRNNIGIIPSGSNLGYADGHVGWKNWNELQHQITLGQQFYW